jgi:hypothetical protein
VLLVMTLLLTARRFQLGAAKPCRSLLIKTNVDEVMSFIEMYIVTRSMPIIHSTRFHELVF